MVPMIDTLLIPGTATTLLSVGPALVGVGLALIAGVTWIARGTAEELRRTAARDWEQARTVDTPTDRLAA